MGSLRPQVGAEPHRRPEARTPGPLEPPRHEQQGERRPGPAERAQHPIARPQPAERGEQPVGPAPVSSVRPLEEPTRGEDAVISHEARDLQRKRHKGDEVHDAEQANKQPAREDVSRVAGTGGPTRGDGYRCALAAKTVLIMENRAMPSGVAPVQQTRCRCLTPMIYVTPVLARG